ncbi:DUF4349 domain-containing protein [Paenibacillus roseipurpureus]|uniref:DUF4349 domain-containing protein n=1 Tax=Paenibacillus roseopurpureus TaxID=2918901 RepID=A0AA96RPA0_9BACL|nr:DUF4349 domain-containing protein [Paenibacillus sp. MBLB1832]WNR46432.1 DUF4349 domain-containing protein [Paenibacillus sp. MBLB1832]
MGAKVSVKLGGWIAVIVLVVGVLTGCGSTSSKEDRSPSTASSSEMKMVQPEVATSMNQAGGAKDSVAAKVAPAAMASVADANKKQSETSDLKAAPSSAPNAVLAATGSEQDAGFNRKLIYHANIVMPVEDYVKAQTALRDLVALSGAYILQFSENASTNEKGGTFTVKVAAKGFVSLLDGLEKLSPSIQRNVQGQDVTEEYVDLSSRLAAKQLVETRLLSFMEKASKTDDLLAFSNELAKVQETIEQIKGRMRYLDQNVSYSTIEIRMYQQTGKKPLLSDPNELTLMERIEKAWSSSLNVLAAVLQGILVFLAAVVPVLIILLLLAIPIGVYRRKRKMKLQQIRLGLKDQEQLENTNDNE